jgi:hypothetical protein
MPVVLFCAATRSLGGGGRAGSLRSEDAGLDYKIREELFQLHSRLFQLQLGTPINFKPPYKLNF